MLTKHVTTRSRLDHAVAMMLLLVTTGCPPADPVQTGKVPPQAADVSPKNRAILSPSSKESKSSDKVQVVALCFDTAFVDLPVESVRHSRKIWNHVDELRVDPTTLARLARNGIRIGAVSSQGWPAIRAVLDACNAKVRRDHLVPQAGLPLAIETARIQEGETIFSYGRDQRLAGKTYPAGTKLITVDYVFHPQLGGTTELRFTLEIRRERAELTWTQQNGVITQEPGIERFVFSDLIASLVLGPDETAVIGPSGEIENEFLVGGRFFQTTRAGERFETLLFLTPRPFQSPGRIPTPGRTP